MTAQAVVTAAVVEEELVGATAWAARHGWTFSFAPDQLLLTVRTKHPMTATPLQIIGDFDGYRGIPPAWRFVTPHTNEAGAAAFPAPGGTIGSIFHSNRVICAPWNRLAYAENNGPHGDWGGSASWLQVRGVSRATTVGDMLATIELHLGQSPGMMA